MVGIEPKEGEETVDDVPISAELPEDVVITELVLDEVREDEI